MSIPQQVIIDTQIGFGFGRELSRTETTSTIALLGKAAGIHPTARNAPSPCPLPEGEDFVRREKPRRLAIVRLETDLLLHRLTPVGGELVLALVATDLLAEELAAGFGRVVAAGAGDTESPRAVVGRVERDIRRQAIEHDVIVL